MPLAVGEVLAEYTSVRLLGAGVASFLNPHILRIHDRAEYDGQFWISMDCAVCSGRHRSGVATWQNVAVGIERSLA